MDFKQFLRPLTVTIPNFIQTWFNTFYETVREGIDTDDCLIQFQDDQTSCKWKTKVTELQLTNMIQRMTIDNRIVGFVIGYDLYSSWIPNPDDAEQSVTILLNRRSPPLSWNMEINHRSNDAMFPYSLDVYLEPSSPWEWSRLYHPLLTTLKAALQLDDEDDHLRHDALALLIVLCHAQMDETVQLYVETLDFVRS